MRKINNIWIIASCNSSDASAPIFKISILLLTAIENCMMCSKISLPQIKSLRVF